MDPKVRMTTKQIDHKTGFVVYIGGQEHWHRTKTGAIKRAESSPNWYARNITQVIECGTGKLVWGKPA